MSGSAKLSRITDRQYEVAERILNQYPADGGGYRDLTGISQEKLKYLSCAWKNLDPDDFQALAAVTALEALYLYGTPINDAVLSAFPRLLNLRHLNLTQSGITDAGLEHLRQVKFLSELHISQTQVTPSAVEAFRKARPDVQVIY